MTQHINTMNKGILHKYRLLAIGLMLTCLSCSKAQLSPDSDIAIGNSVEMRLTLDAPAFSSVSNNETDINRLRVVVFGSMTSPDAGRLILNKFYATAPEVNPLKEIITSGRRDIFIIVNEPLSGGGEELGSYKSIASVSDVRNLSLAYGGAGAAALYVPSEIPMFIEHINKQVLVDSPNEISGAVERVMAKVTMKLNVKHTNFPTGKHIVIDNITIKNLPQSSSWIAKDYSGALVASEKQNSQVVAAESGYNMSSNNTFYVPEYILANADEGAYIEIIGHINGEPNRIAKYIVKLGDAMDGAGRYGDKYNITRNRHYTFTGDVKSYGEMEDLAVKVTVLPWNTVNMSEEVGHYVAFSKVTNASTVADIADGSNLDDMGQTITVWCSTNIGGWYAVVRNSKGAVVHTSTPTAAVSVAKVQSINVVVPKLTPPYYMDNYTMSVYHSTIAQESVGPVKEVKFTQYGSFIPNSALTAAGWPVHLLPIEGGLQVAAIGNMMPGYTPAADDPLIQWKTSQTTTSGVESVSAFANAKFGMGKSSTDVMIADDVKSGVQNHPAAQYCRAMGPEWYLPSVAELKLIHDNRLLLGASYSFSATNNYWSSTEDSFSSSWLVTFYTDYGHSTVNIKTVPYLVRCVKGTPPLYIEINGLKWAIGNLVADGANGAKIGAPTDGGLYFQFGSLLGWKGGATGDGTGRSSKTNGQFYVGSSFNASNEIHVKPALFTTITAIGTTWPDQAGNNLYYFGHNTAPYATAGQSIRAFAGYATGTLADKGVGDPCTYYLGSPWRQPTNLEYQALHNASTVSYTGSWSNGSATSYLQYVASGKTMQFPASGLRNTDGSMSNVGDGGYYWSESVHSADLGYFLLFYSGHVNPQNNFYRRYGFPARCVQ